MDCKQCRERLHDFLDETLEAAERAQVSAHAADCDACRRELEELRKAAALVGSLDELPEPAGFLQAVRERIARPTLWERFQGLLARPLRPGVSVGIPVIIVALFAVFVVMNLPPRSPRRAEKAAEARPRERVEIAYGFQQEPPSAGADESRSFGRGKAGPSEPTEGFMNKRSREAGDKTEEGKSLADADNDSLRRAKAAGGTPEGNATAGELEEETEVVSRQEVEGTELGRTRVAEESGTATEKAEAGTATNGVSREEHEETDLAEAGETQQTVNGALFIGGAGHRSDETVIELVVFDLPTDVRNVQKIVDEEGGQLVENRAKDALVDLLLQVPTSNFDRTVQRLNYYNETNKLAIEQEKDQKQDQTIRNNRAAQLAKGQQRQGWLKPLPLIVQRIIKKPAADE
jgi:hypothetical protein